MMESEDSQYLLDSKILFDKQKPKKLMSSPECQKKRTSSNAIINQNSHRIEHDIEIPDHIKRVNINKDLLTS